MLARSVDTRSEQYGMSMIRFPSPGFSKIQTEIGQSNRNHILDFGEMRPGTFQYLSGVSCKFHFENLCDVIHHDMTPQKFFEYIDRCLAKHTSGTFFDVVLTWDYINFLSLDDIIVLFDRLRPYCKENTFIHSLTYIKKNIPVKPSRFQMCDDNHLDIDLENNLTQKTHAFTSLAIVKSLPHFSMETSNFGDHNVRAGIVENVFRYVPNSANQNTCFSKRKYSFKVDQKRDVINHETNNTIGGTTHFSPALAYIFDTLHNKKATNVLNLSCDTDDNNRILSQYADNIFPESLLPAMRKVEGGFDLELRKQNLIYSNDIKFDAILIWDIFNFIRIEDIQRVSERLHSSSKPGTLIYLINYSGSEKPVSPHKFHLRGEGNTEFLPKQNTKGNVSVLTAAMLSKTFKGAKITKNHFLEKGMCKGFYEYVLEYTPTNP